LDRIYRIILIVAAAVIGGLVLYALVPDVTPYVGTNGAALLSWFLIFASGVAAHFLLPKRDLSQVTAVLLALLASTIAAVVTAWLLMVLVDFPVDDGGAGQLLLVGAVAFVFASLVFVPTYVFCRKIGGSPMTICLLSGVLLPAACIFILRPFGDEQSIWLVFEAAAFSLIGASASLAFVTIATRTGSSRVKET